jgi:hypothetical protein
MLTDFRMITTPPPLAPGDVKRFRASEIHRTASYTLRDLNALFGRADMDVLWRKWRKDSGFPQPLPWSRKPLRWNAEAVLRWKAAREAEAGSL